MATGRGDFGYEDPALDRDLDHNSDNDDEKEQEVNITREFQPGIESTPYHGGEEHEMQTIQHEQSGLPDTSYDEIPLLGGYINQDDKPARGETEILKKDGSGLLKKVTNKFKASLGPEAESLIAQDNEEIRETRQSLREAEIQLQQAERIGTQKEKAAQEVRDLRIRIERAQAKIDQLGSNVEIAALEKQAKQKAKEQTRVDQRASLAPKESERNTLQDRLNDTRTLDDLKEKEAELKRQNEEDQAVIEDENASPTDKQAAEERVAERTEELGRLQTQIAERERALPLRERIKEIFKKMA
ncbi:hypothetical protein ACROYT_G022400 [Oculina patagonica]